MKKKIALLSSIILFLLVISGCGNKANQFPEYNETKKDVELLSSNKQELNEQQENAFYSIARNVVGKEADMLHFDDFTLFVKKVKGEKGKYYLEYACENPTTKMRFMNKMNITIKDNNVEEYEYDWEMLESDLWDFLENV